MVTIQNFVDTETAGSLDNPIVYNINVHTKGTDNNVNVLVDEIFFDPDLMNTAYYANKRPIYIDDMWDGKIIAERFWAARKQILDMISDDPKVKTQFFAHNAAFDVRALNNTCRVLSGGKVKYFFPYGTEICDTLKMARQVVAKMPTYIKFCEENGYMTKHAKPRPRLTAEILYRFITKDNDFEEAHRAAEDVAIEEQIYDYIMKQHKKCDKVLYHAKEA